MQGWIRAQVVWCLLGAAGAIADRYVRPRLVMQFVYAVYFDSDDKLAMVPRELKMSNHRN
jgi:hypothetical protein